jgi:hypothetical protein
METIVIIVFSKDPVKARSGVKIRREDLPGPR